MRTPWCDVLRQKGVAGVADADHDEAQEAAEKAVPDLAKAAEITAQYTADELIEIAQRGYADPKALTPDEYKALCALVRVRFVKHAG